MDKKTFTIKKTGYILKSESLKEALQSMSLAKNRITDQINGFVLPNKKKVEEECGHETPKKVHLVITVTMEEI